MIYPVLVEYEKSLEEARRSVEADPDADFAYNNLALDYMSLDRLQDAENTLQRADERKLAPPDYLVDRYREFASPRRATNPQWTGLPPRP